MYLPLIEDPRELGERASFEVCTVEFGVVIRTTWLLIRERPVCICEESTEHDVEREWSASTWTSTNVCVGVTKLT